MQWIANLINSESVAQAVLVMSVVAALGIAIGSIKIRGVGLGVAGVLFSGILVGHLMGGREHGPINHEIMEFAREFGLILFVYAIGVQVGPGFFASLRKNGLGLNLMAAAIVLLGVVITVGIIKIAKVDVPVAVGLFSGGTTNTPSLAAAQEAMKDVRKNAPETLQAESGRPGLGYAIAYPFGIIGIIVTMVLTRLVFRVDLKAETEALAATDARRDVLTSVNLEVTNPNLDGLPLRNVPTLDDEGVVVSRILAAGGEAKIARPDTVLHKGDVLLAVGIKRRLDELKLIVGSESKVDVKAVASSITARTVVVTKAEALGKTVEQLNLIGRLGVAVTRVSRAAIELPATGVPLQFGDRLLIVGEPVAIGKAADELGDSVARLNHPEIIPIFIGIGLGVLLGTLPVMLPGMPAPVKLGLAGGPLVVAILLSRLGHFGKLVWYLPSSANLMIKELGIVLFLACVGLKSGGNFVATLKGDGLYWMGLAALITIVPLLLVAAVGRIIFKTNYLTLCGLLAGSMTDPPALAFAGSVTKSDAPSVSYATVYPLVMLLRVLAGQAIVLILL
jgi:putative transport protein